MYNLLYCIYNRVAINNIKSVHEIENEDPKPIVPQSKTNIWLVSSQTWNFHGMMMKRTPSNFFLGKKGTSQEK